MRRRHALDTGIEEAVIFKSVYTKIFCLMESFVGVLFIPECFAVGHILAMGELVRCIP